jgi:subtilisin
LAVSANRHASQRFKRSEPSLARRVRVYPNLGLALGNVTAAQADALANDERVEQVEKAPELSLIRPVAARPAKLGLAPSWGITRIKADQLWAAGFTGKGVVVGHLDTGVDGSHPVLQGAIAAFAEFDMAGDQVPGAKPHDSGEHGTHTAGTIASRGGTKGPFGVAPEARLASAMVIEGGQVIDRILAGMEWMVGQQVRILSMSLGLRGFEPSFQVVVDALRAANVLPVFAVGNEFANSSRSPGNYANVLSIGAMDSSNRIPDFSSSQLFGRPIKPLVPDLVAPGVGVLSSIPDGKFAEMDGTSMATPHVAGLAALLLQAKPNATAAELEQAIVGSCALPANMPAARGNRGVPDAVQAFVLLTGAALPAAAEAAAKPRRQKAKARAARPGRTPTARRGGPGRTRRAAAAVAKTRKRTKR